jgi:hypothetical protein
MNGNKCADCGGSGFIICVEWKDDGYNDYPGTYGTFSNIGREEDAHAYWQETCKLCKGSGYTDYDEQGRLTAQFA